MSFKIDYEKQDATSSMIFLHCISTLSTKQIHEIKCNHKVLQRNSSNNLEEFFRVLQILWNNLIFEVCKNVYIRHIFCILSSGSIFKSALLLCLRGKEAF